MNPRLDVRAALAAARRAGVAALDAEVMLARLLGIARSAVIARDEAVLDADRARRWANWLGRRAAGEPLAYLLGEKEFRGLAFRVTADVLVPRPETELLVEWALEAVAGWPAVRRLTLVDLGTGSGAIAVSLAVAAGARLDVVATDVSDAALAVARGNAAAHGVGDGVELVRASWWHGLAERAFDIAVANPPYVAAGDPALAALRHEPLGALHAGDDGEAALREIVAGAPARLRRPGRLLVEHGSTQGAAVRRLLAAAGFSDIETRADLAGLERASGGRLDG